MHWLLGQNITHGDNKLWFSEKNGHLQLVTRSIYMTGLVMGDHIFKAFEKNSLEESLGVGTEIVNGWTFFMHLCVNTIDFGLTP